MLFLTSWFYTIFRVTLGVLFVIFILKMMKLLERNSSVRQLAGGLVLFSLLTTLLLDFHASAVDGGISIKWKPLGIPVVGDPAIKVLDVGYIETKSGNIYRSVCVECQDNQWEQVDEVVVNEYAIISPAGTCGTLSFLPFERNDFVDIKSSCTGIDVWGVMKAVYAIDNRGQVYSWVNVTYPGDIAIPWYITLIMYVFIVLIVFIVYLLVLLLLVLFRKIRRRNVE